MFENNDPRRFVFLGYSAARGDPSYFLSYFKEQVRNYLGKNGPANVVFAIGQALKRHVDTKNKQIFQSGFNYDAHIWLAQRAVQVYDEQSLATRRAIFAWTGIGMRFGIVKDIRLFISNMVWLSRSECLYCF